MRPRLLPAVVLPVVMAAALSLPAVAFGASSSVEFTGVSYITGGEVGNWFWSGASAQSHQRNGLSTGVMVATDTRASGLVTVEVNSNLTWREWPANPDGTGRAFGTFRINSETGSGYWDGTWVGVILDDGFATHVLRLVGQGVGAYEGLQIRIDLFGLDNTGQHDYWDCSGEIFGNGA